MKYDTSLIRKVLEIFPKKQLTISPTPIYQLERISKWLGCNIYIMREDLTGFCLGGNKVRKLDYLIADAIENGADTLITTVASSFSRNAAAGKAFGLTVHVVLTGSESTQNSASQKLFKQCDTVIHYVEETGENSLQRAYDNIVIKLNNQGKKLYHLHPGGSDSIGSLGYINAFNQIVQFSQDNNIHFNNIIHPTGSTATQVGLLLGQHISQYDTKIIGMAVSQQTNIQSQRVEKLAQATAKMLAIELDSSAIIVDDSFIGSGYPIPSKEAISAANIFASLEGVLLDEIYSGKAAAGLIQYAKSGMFNENDNVLFIHTGGNAGLFY